MVKPVLVNIAALQDYMKRHGLTQKAMAEHLGITPEYFSRVLKQQSSPSLDLLFVLAEVTGEPWWRYMLHDEVVLVRREDAELIRGLQTLLRRDLQPA